MEALEHIRFSLIREARIAELEAEREAERPSPRPGLWEFFTNQLYDLNTRLHR